MKKIKALITFASLLFSLQIFAGRTLSSEISGYLNAHRILNIDFNNPENSMNLMRETNQFIERVGSDQILNSDGGKELLARQKKLRNAFRVKTQLADCGNRAENLAKG